MPRLNQRPLKFYKFHGGLQNVGSSQIASGRISRGPTLHETHLEFLTAAGALVSTANIATEVLLVKFMVGSKVLFQTSGKFLQRLENYMGEANVNGYIRLYHALAMLESRIERDSLAIGTADADEIYVEVTLGAAATTAIINVKGWVDGVSRPFGAHVVAREASRSFGAAGTVIGAGTVQEQEISDFEKTNMSNRGGVSGYLFHMFQLGSLETSVVSSLRIRANGLDRIDRIKREQIEAQNVRSGRINQTGMFVQDWCLDNTLDSVFLLNTVYDGNRDTGVPSIQEFSFYPSWASFQPGTLKILHVQIDELGTLNF